MAALYIRCRMLITRPATITAHTDAVPASSTTASCAAPPKMNTEVAQPIRTGISPSDTASPMTNPNGIAGRNSGIASTTARRSIHPVRVGSLIPPEGTDGS